MTSAQTMARIERKNYIFGGALVLLSIFAQSQKFSLGVAVGVAITCANFAFLSRFVVQVSEEEADKRLVWVLPKMLALVAITLGALFLIPMSPIGFGIGYMVFAISVLGEVLFRPKAEPFSSIEPGQDTGNPPLT